MYVCIYVCVSVCMYICINIYIYISIYVISLSLSIYIYISLYIYIYIYICIHISEAIICVACFAVWIPWAFLDEEEVQQSIEAPVPSETLIRFLLFLSK